MQMIHHWYSQTSTKKLLNLSISFTESNTLLQWCEENRLIMNAEKTQLLNFCISNRSSRATNGVHTILLDDKVVNSSKEVKFLGVFLDENLKFHCHLEHVTKKISIGIFMLRQLRQSVSTEVLLSAYYGLIYPYLTYAVPVWGSESQKTLFLFRLQRKAVRIIFSVSSKHPCKEFFRTYNILTFPSLYILETLSFAHSNMSIFNHSTNSRYPLRNCFNIPVPNHSSTFFQKNFEYNSITLFNSLPSALKTEQDHRKFRSKLKTLLLENAHYSVRDFATGVSRSL